MRHWIRIFALLMVCLVSLMAAVPVLAVPPLPSSFYGIVKVNAANVPDNTLVQALIDGQVYAEARTQTYQGDSVYALDVPGDDIDSAAREGGRDGDTIQFQVGGVIADQTGTWKSATNVNLDLGASSTVTIDTPQPTLSPVPTQTPILVIQPSPTSTKPAQASPTATLLAQPSLLPTARLQPSPTPIPAGIAEAGSSDLSIIVVIFVIAVVVIGLILLVLRRRNNMEHKSSETK